MIAPDSRIWFPFFALLSTAVAIFVTGEIGVADKYITVVSSAISAFLFFILERATNLFMNNYNFRLVFDNDNSKFEGVWFQYYLQTHNGTTIPLYSLSRIRYIGKKEEPYLIKGNTYHGDGTNLSTWTSARIKFDSTSNRIDYFYSGHLYEDQQDVRGFSHLNFNDYTGYVNTSWTFPKQYQHEKLRPEHIKAISNLELDRSLTPQHPVLQGTNFILSA